MEYLKLIGIVIIILGFAFKLDTVAILICTSIIYRLIYECLYVLTFYNYYVYFSKKSWESRLLLT